MERPSKEFLEVLYARHHRLENLNPDPLVFARGRYDPLEGEVSGLISAAFAYGQVDQIVKTLSFVFGRLTESPAKALLSSTPEDFRALSEGFYYRFHKAPDLALFLLLLSRGIEKRGGLLPIFKAHYTGDLGAGISGFCGELLSGDPRPLLNSKSLPARHPTRFLLSSPASGGAAKRMCLFLRWMARRDELDPGYWLGEVPPSALVVPLDVHVARVGRFFGFTGRKDGSWKTALEITEALKRYDPEDPLRYDFSLFRYGMKDFQAASKGDFSPA